MTPLDLDEIEARAKVATQALLATNGPTDALIVANCDVPALVTELRRAWDALAARARASTYGAGSPAPVRGCAWCERDADVIRPDAHALGICRGCVATAATHAGLSGQVAREVDAATAALREELARVTQERDEARAALSTYDPNAALVDAAEQAELRCNGALDARDAARAEADALRDLLRAANASEHARRAAEWKRRHKAACEIGARWKAKATSQSAEIHALHREMAEIRGRVAVREAALHDLWERAEGAVEDANARAETAERELTDLRRAALSLIGADNDFDHLPTDAPDAEREARFKDLCDAWRTLTKAIGHTFRSQAGRDGHEVETGCGALHPAHGGGL